jgi:hypothetical protein
MVLAGGAAAALWEHKRDLWLTLAWACTLCGLVNGLCIFLFIGTLVFNPPAKSQEFSKKGPSQSSTYADYSATKTGHDFASGVGVFLGFGIPMLLCGAAGIGFFLEFDLKAVIIRANSADEALKKAETEHCGWKAEVATPHFEYDPSTQSNMGMWKVTIRSRPKL